MLNCTSSLETITRELRAGRPVIFPTDTVCGLGVSVIHAPSPESLYALKQRPPEKPIAWLVAGVSDLEKFGAHVPAYAFELAKKYWPGALTLVVRASENVPAAYLNVQGAPNKTSSYPTIGVRCPASSAALKLLHEVGGPLCTTSANFSGDPAPAAICDLNPAFAKDLPVLNTQNCGEELISAASVQCSPENVPEGEYKGELKSGRGSECMRQSSKSERGSERIRQSLGIASTVVDCTGPCPIILREGLIVLPTSS